MHTDFQDTIAVPYKPTKRSPTRKPAKNDGLWWVMLFIVMVIYVTLPLWVTPR